MITINPENPSLDDSVVFVFTGIATCKMPSTHIVDSNFYFDMVYIDPPPPCISAPIPYEIEWSVGRLKAGDYQVTQLDLGVEIAMEDFSVAEGLLPFPEPAIPSIGFVGAIILAIGLAWIANKAFKTDAQKRAA